MRHRRMLAPINTVKHYVHRSNLAIASGGITAISVVDAVVAPATTNPFDVKEGAVVKAVHLEYWLLPSGDTGETTQFAAVLEKVPANAPSVTAAQTANLGSYLNKKNILWTSQGVLGQGIDGQSSVPVIRNWVLIPKGKQRFGQGDRLMFSVAPIATTLQICGLSTFKEYI